MSQKQNCNHCIYSQAYTNDPDKYYCSVMRENLTLWQLSKDRECIEFKSRGRITLKKAIAKGRRVLRLKCICCGEEVPPRADACYCDACRERETTKDNEIIDKALENKNVVKEIATAVITQAIRDYKQTLYAIKNTPCSNELWEEKEELEEFFTSKEFNRFLAVLIDYGDDSETFTQHSINLIAKLRRECRFDQDRYCRQRNE